MATINARDEFVKLNESCRSFVQCAFVSAGDKDFLLPAGYGDESFERFIESLDFCYDNSTEYLDGVIWFMDDAWAQRLLLDDQYQWCVWRKPDIPYGLR